jgi:putative two-component system response regulator
VEYREGGLTHRVLRVGEYVGALAEALGMNGRTCEVLAQAAALYDVGKLGVPEHILTKTEALNEWEWGEMRKHPQVGAEIIGEHRDPLLAQARVMALTHHERWDGAGYPARLKAEAIPVAGRIMALVDAFEAMTSTQRHRAAVPSTEAARRIAAESGRQFDPAMVGAFMKAVKTFDEIRSRHADELAGIHDLDFGSPPKPL